MEIEKNLIIMEKSWNFVKLFDETNSSRKTSCQSHTKLVCLTASFLATGGFKLHGEDVAKRGAFKIVMEIILLIMENHGIVFLNVCGNPGPKHTMGAMTTYGIYHHKERIKSNYICNYYDESKKRA